MTKNIEWEYKNPAPKGELVEVELFMNNDWAKFPLPEGFLGYRTQAKRVKVDTYRIEKFRTPSGDMVSRDISARCVIRWRPMPDVQ